jgi:hypothetical protein
VYGAAGEVHLKNAASSGQRLASTVLEHTIADIESAVSPAHNIPVNVAFQSISQ